MRPTGAVFLVGLILGFLSFTPPAWAPGYITLEAKTYHFQGFGTYWACICDKTCLSKLADGCGSIEAEANTKTGDLQRRKSSAEQLLGKRASSGESVDKEARGLANASADLDASQSTRNNLIKSCADLRKHIAAIKRLGPLDPNNEDDKKRADKTAKAAHNVVKKIATDWQVFGDRLTAADAELKKVEAKR